MVAVEQRSARLLGMGKSLHWCSFALICGLLLSFSGAAHAQGMVFDDDDTEVIVASEAAQRFLQEGMDFYDRADYVSASIFFWRVITDTDPGARPLRPSAQFEMGKTLVRMNMLQSALLFFDEVIAMGEAHPHFEDSAPWIILIANRLPGNMDMLRRVNAFSPLFPDRIASRYHDEMAFLLGQHLYNAGELERALQFLGFVPEGSQYYMQALFLRGVTHVRLYDAREAARSFLHILSVIERARGQRGVELRALAQLTELSVARTLYSTGDYERSLEYYSMIGQSSPYWLQAIFEAAWANFQLERYNVALGNLHTLNSPFFNDQFYPEAPLLRAVIYFYNCRFAEVRRAIEDFTYTYEPLREELEQQIDALNSNREFYEFLINTEARMARRFNPRLQAIVNAALEDRTLTDSLEYISALDTELRLIRTVDRGWSNSEFARYIFDQTTESREVAISQAGQMVRNRLQAILDDLLEREREAQALLIETGLAEAGALSPSLRDELYRGRASDAVTGRPPAHILRWSFSGEYWKDELGHYSYAVTSACR